MNPENQGQQILPGMARVRLTDSLERFALLIAKGFDDNGKKLTNTQCAINAGIGRCPKSSKTLASRYLKDPRVIARINELRESNIYSQELHNDEIISALREGLNIALGREAVRRTTVSQIKDVGSLAETHNVYDPDLAQAAGYIKLMGGITGLITGDKQRVEHSGGIMLGDILSDLDGKTAGLGDD